MRKLFTDAWLQKRSLSGSWHAAEGAALEKHWKDWLGAALARFKHAPAPRSGNREDTLRALKGSDLLALDPRIRAEIRYEGTLEANGGTADSHSADDSETDAYLFVASCHPNGYIREQALLAFRERGGPLALAAGLICSTNWVDVVRNAAISLVEDVVPRLPPADVVRYLDLAVNLKGRLRVAESLWHRSIKPKLATRESREVLWDAARNLKSSRVLRHAAFEFLLLHESASHFDVFEQAIRDPDPVTSRWGFDRSAAFLPRHRREPLVTAALRHAHASVRQRALREYVDSNSNPADSAETLRAALLDSARGVRSLAAFELRRRFHESPLPVWRAAVTGSSRRQAQAATLALFEAGERQDVEALAERARHQNAAIRAALLRALERRSPGRLRQCLEAALFDNSSVVLRQAAHIYRRCAVPLLAGLLDNALAKASDRLVPNVMALALSLGGWNALELLLRHAAESDSIRAACAARQVIVWCEYSSRGLPSAPADQAARLRDLFAAAKARHPGHLGWPLLEFILRTQQSFGPPAD